MADYESTLAGEVRRIFASGAFPLPGDSLKIAQAMIDSVDRGPAPERLAALDAPKDIALSTDVDA
jgi:hypothetical protein